MSSTKVVDSVVDFELLGPTYKTKKVSSYIAMSVLSEKLCTTYIMKEANLRKRWGPYNSAASAIIGYDKLGTFDWIQKGHKKLFSFNFACFGNITPFFTLLFSIIFFFLFTQIKLLLYLLSLAQNVMYLDQNMHTIRCNYADNNSSDSTNYISSITECTRHSKNSRSQCNFQ